MFVLLQVMELLAHFLVFHALENLTVQVYGKEKMSDSINVLPDIFIDWQSGKPSAATIHFTTSQHLPWLHHVCLDMKMW